ncbi:MAG: hypothetical protein IJK97_01500 [Thermoguttaceae bacterium]|nr:hypothetical protein [Thermoguttaceae bacterium]MBR0192017.1 hypothetical protein [Thermoguttaceae bacterium]
MRPIQRQLDHFRDAFRHHVVEYALEVVFISVGAFFLLGSGLDFALWWWKFWEFPLLRWLILAATLVVLALESRFLFRAFRKIPKTRFETFHFLCAMRNRPSASSDPPPSLPKQLENALDFLERPQPAAGEELREAVITQTDTEMEGFRPSDWLRLERFWRARWILRGFTVLFFFVFAIFAAQCGENGPVAVERFVMPWKTENAWKIDFRPQWKAIPKELVAGETFDAEISLRKNAAQVQVAVWASEDAQEPAQILRVEPIFGRFLVRIPNVQKSFWVSLCMPGENPRLSERLPVKVRTYARLTNVILRLQPPASTHQKPAETGWEISGLQGSRIGVMIAADRPLQEARLRFSNRTYVPGEPVDGGASRVFKFRFELLQECDYWLELTDQTGLTSVLERHPIRMREDLSPIVACESPEDGRPFLPGAKLPLKFQAQDDFGLTAVGFQWVTEKPDAGAVSGFSFPQANDGTPKWTVFSVWNAADPETGEIPDVPLPLSQTAEFTWDLASVPLEAGMRVRVEAFAIDSEGNRTVDGTIYFNAVTPEAMQFRAFQQWISITQELRRVGNLLTQSRKRLDDSFTEKAPETANFLAQGMETIQRLLDSRSPNGLPAALESLEQELDGNPEFPFHASTTSKAQLATLRDLRGLLKKLEAGPISELNREIVLLSKSLQLPGGTDPAKLESFRGRLTGNLEQILQILHPQLKEWNREEFSDAMVRDFEALAGRQKKLAEGLQPILNQAENRAPMEIRLEHAAALQSAEEEIWAIRSELERFLVQYDEIFDENFRLKTVPTIRGGLEMELHALKENRLWDFQRENVQLNFAFEASVKSLGPQSPNPLRDELQVFGRMLASEEQILHLLEETNTPENVVKQDKTEIVPLTRAQRKAFRDCATVQILAGSYFTQREQGAKPTLPRVLAPLWEDLTANLQVSVQDFQTISVHHAPPLELLEDQYTLQLQIYDQLAELAQIADGLTPEMGKLVKNSDFENRLSNPKKPALGEDETDGEPETSAEDGDDETPKEESEILPADVLILISMQSIILEQTKALAEDEEKKTAEKADQAAFLAEQERKTAQCAKKLGFDAVPNSAFDEILAQMYQVMFLLEKQDLGEMTISIQEEILYGLRSALQRQEVPDETQNAEDGSGRNEATHEKEDLSENADSQAQKPISGQNPAPGEDVPAAPTALETLQNDYWGELPTRQRDILRLVPGEKPIPGYEKALEMYYRKLRDPD